MSSRATTLPGPWRLTISSAGLCSSASWLRHETWARQSVSLHKTLKPDLTNRSSTCCFLEIPTVLTHCQLGQQARQRLTVRRGERLEHPVFLLDQEGHFCLNHRAARSCQAQHGATGSAGSARLAMKRRSSISTMAASVLRRLCPDMRQSEAPPGARQHSDKTTRRRENA
jgi:hypothetical protein